MFYAQSNVFLPPVKIMIHYLKHSTAAYLQTLGQNEVTASDTIMHRVLIILTLTFIQGHTDILNVRIFQTIFNQCPSRLLNYCEDSQTKGPYDLFLVRLP